ncbi:Gfo/Idh/MocA family oxidoreductase [Paenarthrobacter sp. DKR-5]|uniref:Gfo/Idh/MocA family protein n=1 Tax=Paenarthrobacter sp. DKR-5 TaxID=2835535 RepID=UPI001BDDA0B4|nr:Gfo/Idh/MocA family oxidoreductase [Paenarthrobacter sp. DKR-5]MBT1003460.1 Gfo/Idh/MocA family oxidoreductase [Paenarthrobacter sp. DKR-5]
MSGPGGAARLRVAVVGAGMIGEVHRRAAVLAGAELAGVMASSPERSREAAAAWRTQAFGDIDAVAASDVDVVHICTPNSTHTPYVLRLLEAGKHVICEKPLATSTADAERMAVAAAEAGVVAAVPFVYRYHPLVREIRARRQAGEFGPWNLLHGSYLQDWLLSPDASSWRVDPAAGGASRAFGDIGSHWCDLVEWVSGERFTSLTAQTSITVPERPAGSGASFGGESSGDRVPVQTEDAAALLLRTGTGVLASATVSQVSAGRKNRLWFELDGALGSAVFDQENPEQIWLGGEEGSRLLVRDPAHGSAEQRRLSVLPGGHAQGYAQCFEAFVADTYDAVAGGKPEGLPTFQDGVRSARIVEAVLASAASGRWTEVGGGSLS